MILPNRDNRAKFLAAVMGAPKKDYAQGLYEEESGPKASIVQSECRDCMKRFMAALSAQDADLALEEFKNLLAVIDMEEEDD